MSRQSDRRATHRLRVTATRLSLPSHAALGSLTVVLVSSTFMDFGVPELLATTYCAALMYGAMDLCLNYLREHAPAAPRPMRRLPLLGYLSSAVLLTAGLWFVTGTNPLALTQSNLLIATTLFVLFFAAFVDPVTNQAHLRQGRDPRRPYAHVPPWPSTWRAATLPMALLLVVAYLGSTADVAPAIVAVTLYSLVCAHVLALVAFSRRRGDP